MSNANYSPERFEALITCDGIGKVGKLKLLRAHVAAEVAKATAEDTELLNWIQESKADLTHTLRDKWAVVHEDGVASMYETVREAIRAARAQQKDT